MILKEDKNDDDQVMQVSVISDYDKCLKMVKELKLAAGRFKKCVEMNKEEEDGKRITIDNTRCCMKVKSIDAE